MRDGVDRRKMIAALHRAMVATFDESKWMQLSLLLGQDRVVISDPKFLGSARWKLDDYAQRALPILQMLLGRDDRNVGKIEEFVALEAWLRANDTELHADLYGGADLVPLTEVEQAGHKLDIAELNQHAARIRSGMQSDPGQAIGSAKDLLETVFKTVLGVHGCALTDDDIGKLSKKAWHELGLGVNQADPAISGANTIRRVLGNLGQVVGGVAEVRNLYGAGHGRAKAGELEIAHARLVVNSAVAVGTFLLEVWQAKHRP
jgi:hypothetical protein